MDIIYIAFIAIIIIWVICFVYSSFEILFEKFAKRKKVVIDDYPFYFTSREEKNIIQYQLKTLKTMKNRGEDFEEVKKKYISLDESAGFDCEKIKNFF